MMTKERDTYVDFLRTLGLLLIFVAHTKAPNILSSIRTFDVPLMVFVSALCVNFRGGYLTYVIKRVKRIYFPVVQFLLLFLITIIPLLITNENPFSLIDIIGSFLLLNEPSIGYVWIMRIFLIMALIAPPLKKFCNRIDYKYLILLLILLVLVSECIVVWIIPLISNKILELIFTTYIPYAIGYSPLLVLGFMIKDRSLSNNLLLFAILSLIFLLTLKIENFTFNPQASKYPPHGVFLTYGLLCSFILWYARPILKPLSTNRIVTFISKNSMWLYLLHILPVYLIRHLHVQIVENSFVVRYSLVLSLTFVLFTFWNCFLKLIKRYRVAK